MTIKIRCLKCGKLYVCNQHTTELVGPILGTTCTECGHFTQKNYSAFLWDQTEDMERKIIGRAQKMIALSHMISKVVSNEEAFQRKK